jgi:hypothetical protein
MIRSRLSPAVAKGTETRIFWKDGPFRVECSGRGAPMKLCVYYGRFVMAEEIVESAKAAFTRSSEICRHLAVGSLEDTLAGLTDRNG